MHGFDMGIEFTFTDGIEEFADFVRGAADLEFDTSVRQVLHPAEDVESLGNRANRVTEPDTLHSSLIINLAPNHGWVNSVLSGG